MFTKIVTVKGHDVVVRVDDGDPTAGPGLTLRAAASTRVGHINAKWGCTGVVDRDAWWSGDELFREATCQHLAMECVESYERAGERRRS